MPGITTTDASGTWVWGSPPSLAMGNYFASFTFKDTKGNKGTTTLQFNVDESGEARATQSTQETGEVTIAEEVNILQRVVELIKSLLNINSFE